VDAQQIQPPFANALAHRPQVAERLLFRVQVPKAVDRVEGDVVSFAGREIGHVRFPGRFWKSAAPHPLVAERDRFGVQVDPGNLVALFGQRDQQPSGAAGGFE